MNDSKFKHSGLLLSFSNWQRLTGLPVEWIESAPISACIETGPGLIHLSIEDLERAKEIGKLNASCPPPPPKGPHVYQLDTPIRVTPAGIMELPWDQVSELCGDGARRRLRALVKNSRKDSRIHENVKLDRKGVQVPLAFWESYLKEAISSPESETEELETCGVSQS